MSAAEYIDVLGEELLTLGPSVRDMLAGREPADPTLLLVLVRSAAIALHQGPREALPSPAIELAHSIVASARRAPGKKLLEDAYDDMDLDGAADLDAEEDDEPEEVQGGLHRLFELGMLCDVLTGARRERLVQRLELTAGEIMAAPDRFAPLYETAVLLSRMADLPDEHPVAELLATIEAVTDELAHLAPAPSPVEASAIVTAARDRYEASLSPVERLLRWGKERWGELAASFEAPLRVAAASERPGPAWPAPRAVLARRDDIEVALVPRGAVLLVEVAGRSLASNITAHIAGEAHELSRLDGGTHWHRLWELTPEADIASASLVIGIAGEDWAVSLSDARPANVPAVSGHPWRHPYRLGAALARSPGAVAAELTRLASLSAGESLALALDFEAQADRIHVPRLANEVGKATFVVVQQDALVPGFLVRVGAAGLGTGVPADRLGITPDAIERVAEWVGALVGSPGALSGAALDLRFEVAVDLENALAIEGDSWQLGAALAVISERLGRAPRGVVASGALGTHVGEVLAVGHATSKRSAIGSDAPDARTVLMAEAAFDARPALAAIFGDDWVTQLRAALGAVHDALARDAIRAWKRWFARRNTVEIGAEVDEALALAERALAAGVGGVHRIEALWVEGACRLHRGESERAAAIFALVDEDLARASPGQVPAWVREELAAYHGIALVDLGRPAAARAHVVPVLARMDAARADITRIDRRFFEVRQQVAGTLQRAAAFAGDLEAARALLVESLALSLPEERARTLMDLADVERRANDLSASRERLVESREALEEIPSPAMRAMTERYLAIYEARAGVTPLDTEVVPARWVAWPEPFEVLEVLVAGPVSELVAWVRDQVLASPASISSIHLLTVLGALARVMPELSTPSEVGSVVSELVPILLARDGLEDDVRRAVAEVPTGGGTDWVKRCPY